MLKSETKHRKGTTLPSTLNLEIHSGTTNMQNYMFEHIFGICAKHIKVSFVLRKIKVIKFRQAFVMSLYIHSISISK